MPGAGAEVADDLALAELLVHGLEVGDMDGDGAAAALAGRAGCGRSKPASSASAIRSSVWAQRVLADPLDADLLDPS